jgi:hypothetical protein
VTRPVKDFLRRLRRLRELNARPWLVKAEQVNLIFARDLARGRSHREAYEKTSDLYEVHVRPKMGKD